MKTTKILISMIVVMFMPGISVQAQDVTITYDFDDGTLQGWSNLEGAPDEVFVVRDSGQARSPNNMVLEDTFGDRDSDTVVKVLTSPAFWISATTSVEIWAIGGVGAVDAPTWTNYSNLPALATDTDFLGAALRRVSDGEYLLFTRRSQVGEGAGGHVAIGWDAPTIAAAVAGDSPGEQYVVDIIDTYTAHGASPWWAWIGVDDITLTDVVFTRPTVARGPNPEDEADDVPRDTVLSWTPGEFANKHDVYFGASFDDVNDADKSDRRGVLAGEGQIATTYDAGRLDFGQTYYWRIDEVNAPPDSTIFKGDVWSFTVEPFAYPIDGANITATASSSMAGGAPERTIDGSGLDDSDQHSTDLEDMWLSDFLGTQPTWIEYQFDKVYKLHEMWIWNQNQLIESAIGYGFKDVSIEYSVDGVSYTTLGTTHEFAQGPGAVGYAANTTIDFGGAVAKYVKLTANSNWGDILTQYGLSEVRFFSIPVFAREPNPDLGATEIDVEATLSWRAGREAA
ncbi:MAG: discoidin domain-containing protein, partial [Phycisphaerales bacterium]